MEKIINDLKDKLHLNIINIENFREGTTNSLVFSVNKKYLIKTMEENKLISQEIFLNFYKNFNYFQRIIFVNYNLKYICYEYINGIKIKETEFNLNIMDEFYRITKNYKKYHCNFYGYFDYKCRNAYDFLKSEIDYAKEKIKHVNKKQVYKALNNLKDYKIEKYLLHGDFGFHNMLVENNKIRVIDAMPLVFDSLYDFYFACLSSTISFNNIDLLFKYYERDLEYKKNLFIIVFYIKMSRAFVYNKEKFNDYLTMYNKLEEILKCI